MSILKTALCAALVLSSTLVHADDLISNGSFEQGQLINNYAQGAMLVNPGSSSVPDWTIVSTGGSAIAWIDNSNGPANTVFGERFMDLTGVSLNPTGFGVQQTIATVAGMHYTLGFDIGNSALPDYGSTSSINAVAGNASQIFTTGGDGSGSAWQHFTLDFTATDNTTNIALLTQGSAGGRNYVGLDNVSVMAAVPEPETYAMVLSGLGLIGFASRRRKAVKLG